MRFGWMKNCSAQITFKMYLLYFFRKILIFFFFFVNVFNYKRREAFKTLFLQNLEIL